MAGVKEAQAGSEAQEEMEEEAAQMMNRFGEEAQQPGQPQFVFVATLSHSDREKAMSEAFTKAKAQAAGLAKAAGVPLGPLVGLSGTCRGQERRRRELRRLRPIEPLRNHCPDDGPTSRHRL